MTAGTGWLSGALLAPGLACALACGAADDSGGRAPDQANPPGGDGQHGHDDDPLDSDDDGTPAFDNPQPDAGPAPACAGDGAGDGGCDAAWVPGDPGERIDLLFVVDNSHSMEEEQAALADQFPRMLRKLVTGDHDEDGTSEFVRVTDLHLGVISSDLGVGPQGITGCDGQGDDGVLLHEATVQSVALGGEEVPCAGPYPRFLEYEEASGSAERLATEFACIAILGTEGCGFEAPLESALKALWPSGDNRIGFLSFDGPARVAHGDTLNAGFLRNRKQDGPGTLAIVLVTDEDDCSAWDHGIFSPNPPEDHPLSAQDLNVRCFHNPGALYPIERYLSAYRGLYTDAGGRVVFAAIAGVPVDLVDQPALAMVDFNDPQQRQAHYQGILDDPRMQKRVHEGAEPVQLVPSCESELGLAYPPRRIVELARRFGPDSLVQSICGDNLGPPIEIVIRQITTPL